MAITAPRGTSDILPSDSALWQKVESVIRDVCRVYGYEEIRTPIFEHTELFERGVGEATDIVEKEMYTFEDRGERSLTLRPEGTASVVRSYIEHKMNGLSQPNKLYYIGPMFRYERPQAGRYRQFHQFGLEAFGAGDPMIDAEIIMVPIEIFKRLGITDVVVNLNSIGCNDCRPKYKEKLKEFYAPQKDELCEMCIKRFDRNPLRLLDCKVEKCKKIVSDPPKIYEMLCPECEEHLAKLRAHLDKMGVKYVMNSRLVRGLDYYSRTTFEYTFGGIGSQDALGGGGRYDSLVGECGGPDTPAVGMAGGIERCIMAMKAQSSCEDLIKRSIDAYFVAFGSDECRYKAFYLAQKLREANISCDFDVMNRSLKAQMRAADKLNARYVVIIGEEELSKGIFTIKNLEDGSQSQCNYDELVAVIKG